MYPKKFQDIEKRNDSVNIKVFFLILFKAIELYYFAAADRIIKNRNGYIRGNHIGK